LPEDDLRKSLPRRPRVINPCVSDVFERKILDPLGRLIDVQSAIGVKPQDLFDLFAVYVRMPSKIYNNPPQMKKRPPEIAVFQVVFVSCTEFS